MGKGRLNKCTYVSVNLQTHTCCTYISCLNEYVRTCLRRIYVRLQCSLFFGERGLCADHLKMNITCLVNNKNIFLFEVISCT